MPTTGKIKTLDELCNFHEKQLIATQMADTHTFTLYGGSLVALESHIGLDGIA